MKFFNSQFMLGAVLAAFVWPASVSAQKVTADVQKIVSDPSFQQAVVDKGSVPDLRTKEQWTIFLADLTSKYSDLVKSGKVKVAE